MFTNPAVWVQWDCFQFGAVIKTAMNILAKVSVVCTIFFISLV